MSFTLTDYPQFYGLEISLSNILIIGKKIDIAANQ